MEGVSRSLLQAAGNAEMNGDKVAPFFGAPRPARRLRRRKSAGWLLISLLSRTAGYLGAAFALIFSCESTPGCHRELGSQIGCSGRLGGQ